jgi:hypothetical protein
MAALTPCNQNSGILLGSNPQKLEPRPSRASDSRVAGVAQKAIAAIPSKCNLPPASSRNESFMSQQSLASLCAEFGLGSIIEEQAVSYRNPSSEEQAWLLAYEGGSGNSGGDPLPQAEECRHSKEIYSEEYSSDDFSDVDELLKEMEGGVITIDEEREIRIAKARQLEQGRQYEPMPAALPRRLRVVPISPLVPKAIREVFNRAPFNAQSLIPGPCIHREETVFGDRQPREFLGVR